MNDVPKQSDDLAREGRRSQQTGKGITIPVPTRDEAVSLFKKAAHKTPREKQAKPKQ
jgi:hypothetical protein